MMEKQTKFVTAPKNYGDRVHPHPPKKNEEFAPLYNKMANTTIS